MKRALVVSGALVIACGLAGCEETPISPTANQSPFITGQFAGTWAGATVPVRVSGGECVGADLRASAPGVNQGTVTLTQNASDLSAVIRSETHWTDVPLYRERIVHEFCGDGGVVRRGDSVPVLQWGGANSTTRRFDIHGDSKRPHGNGNGDDQLQHLCSRSMPRVSRKCLSPG